MERINVRVGGELKRRLEAEARERGLRPSEVVRQALEDHLRGRAPREDCRQLAERLGLLGSVRGLPPDLSTNLDPMEGFGSD